MTPQQPRRRAASSGEMVLIPAESVDSDSYPALEDEMVAQEQGFPPLFSLERRLFIFLEHL
jgi:hypothetical protein